MGITRKKLVYVPDEFKLFAIYVRAEKVHRPYEYEVGHKKTWAVTPKQRIELCRLLRHPEAGFAELLADPKARKRLAWIVRHRYKNHV